jgi:hypothetical protein
MDKRLKDALRLKASDGVDFESVAQTVPCTHFGASPKERRLCQVADGAQADEGLEDVQIQTLQRYAVVATKHGCASVHAIALHVKDVWQLSLGQFLLQEQEGREMPVVVAKSMHVPRRVSVNLVTHSTFED